MPLANGANSFEIGCLSPGQPVPPTVIPSMRAVGWPTPTSALAFLAAGTDAGIERRVVADYGDGFRTAADQHSALHRPRRAAACVHFAYQAMR